MPVSLAITGTHAPEHTTDSRRMTPPTPQTKAPVNKQSWDYVMRSGLAGGIAGCAVRHSRSRLVTLPNTLCRQRRSSAR
jgi:hypothetical protein